ncbi:MAG: TlyA family RNA methyltransferase [bacterium]
MKYRPLVRELVRRELVGSEGEAREIVEAGRVKVNGFPVDNPQSEVDKETDLVIVENDSPDWVGRGAKKIWPVLKSQRLDVTDKICVDIGASTGGFTQALLRAGARRVYAVDVGYGQLAYRLRQNDKVQVRDRYNFRYAEKVDFEPAPSTFVMDVSFISTLKLLPALGKILTAEGRGILLIKPQFEAPRKQVKDGIIKDPEVWRETLQTVISGWEEEGWGCFGLDVSPLAGGEGNREFVALMSRDQKKDYRPLIDRAVNKAKQ